MPGIRGFAAAAYDLLIEGGKAAGSLLAIAGVAYLPIKTLLEVEDTKTKIVEIKREQGDMRKEQGVMRKEQGDMRKEQSVMMADVASIKAAVLPK